MFTQPPQAAAGSTAQQYYAVTRTTYSYGQPIGHLVALSVLSFGLYILYWCYRSWKQLREQTGEQYSPGWRTVGVLFPIAAPFLAYDLFNRVKVTATSRGLLPTFSPVMLSLAFVFFYVVRAVNSSSVTLPFYVITSINASSDTSLWVITLLSFLSFLPLLPVQNTLNAVWHLQQPDRHMRTHFNAIEIAVLAVGALFLVLVLISAFVPA